MTSDSIPVTQAGRSVTQDKPFRQRIVTLGGGTGHYYLLRGLVQLDVPEWITAIPGTWDDGGSSGRLRTELGVLPPGDARQCMLALMQSDEQRETAHSLFDDRLWDVEGPFKGHSLGNLIGARLDQIYRGQDRGIDAARRLFQIPSQIAPVSLTDLRLIARTSNGITIEGETNIDNRRKRSDFVPEDRIARIHFNTKPTANPSALEAILQADTIVFAPGDLYTSVLPHLLIESIQEAIIESPAKLVFVMNLMTKRGETDDYTASDHLRALVYYIGARDCLDYVVMNDNALEGDLLSLYEAEGQVPVRYDEDACRELVPRATFVRKPLAMYLKREHLLRHDPQALAGAVLELP